MPSYEIVTGSRERELAAMFGELVNIRDDRFFHPHPLTSDEVKKRVQYKGLDLYFLQISAGRISGYGFLRGWDEGYEIPSLGLVIHPKFRGQDLGKDFLKFLHKQAKQQNAKKIRLTVDVRNKIAIKLYKEIGYQLQPMNESILEGFIEV